MTTNSESSKPTAPRRAAGSGTDADPKEATRQQAEHLKGQAQSAASDVADTAKTEASAVQDEAMHQAKSLASNAQDELASQASTQQQRLAEQSRTVTDDLQRISRGEQPESQLVSQAVSSLAERAESLTRQLETKEPVDLLDDVRRFASRRPGTFLLLAAGAGLLAGRLTRGIRDAGSDESQSRNASPASGNGPAAIPEPEPSTPVRGTETMSRQPDTGLGGRP